MWIIHVSIHVVTFLGRTRALAIKDTYQKMMVTPVTVGISIFAFKNRWADSHVFSHFLLNKH